MVLNLAVTPKQKKFMDSRADETLFGGAAGGGKSRGQLVDALLYGLRYPGSRQLMLRRTYPDLERSLVQEHLKFFPLKVYRYNSSTHRGMLKNGSVLEFGYCDKENDVYRYQGAEYDVVRFDELTHFTYNQYIYLMSRVRGVMPFPRGIKSSTNPGGVGHAWVKERFIDPAPAGQMFKAGKRTRLFIPSLVQDNPFLMQGDPEYVQRLEMLPEEQRKALLLGDWDIFSGQVFEEWRNDPTHYKDGAWTHVIEPFEIPSWWKIWRGFDFGYSKPFSVGWYAADGDGKVYRIKEWYGCTKEPNTGLKLTPQEIAEGIREREENDPMLRGRQIIGVADPAIFEESRGESIAQMMVRPPNEAEQKALAALNAEVEEAQKFYPELDLEAELNDPAHGAHFAKLLNSGIDVKTCYEVLHHDEIMMGAMQYAGQKAAQQVAASVQANRNRPPENGGANTGAVNGAPDVAHMSKAERRALIERARSGERVVL